MMIEIQDLKGVQKRCPPKEDKKNLVEVYLCGKFHTPQEIVRIWLVLSKKLTALRQKGVKMVGCYFG